MVSIAVIADYNPESETHIATDNALQHAASELGLVIRVTWVATGSLVPSDLEQFDGIIIGTGVFNDRSNVLAALRFARESGKPSLATCGGFQHMILEYMKNVLNVPDAAHAEFEPAASSKVIVPLLCSLRGREMSISIQPESKVGKLYGSVQAHEKYYCSFGVAPSYTALIEKSPLRIVGSDSEGVLRITELPIHSFYIGTLFVPQVNSRPGAPHPLITGFLTASRSHATF